MSKPRRTFLLVGLGGLAFIGVACLLSSRLAWNLTDSLPRGLYLRLPQGSPNKGDIVAFQVPQKVRRMVFDRRYLPPRAQLFKRVIAVTGDRVCTREGRYSVNDETIGKVLDVDTRGDPLPVHRFCGVVPPGHYYVGSRSPRSFDSRYFGPVASASLTRLLPLWTY